ncbi:MAG: hypothetical protein HPY53_13570 [Brevinematales bacterium]|nr:hypothetical protein [Brevinematales bacterium]
MKTVISLMFMLTMGAVLYADEVVLTSSADTAPKWVTETNQWTMVTNKKVVNVFFKVAGNSDTLDNAKMMAKVEGIGMLAKHIKSIVHYEFEISLKLVDGQFEPYIMSTMSSVSKNIDISGMKKVDTYWELVQDAQSKNKYYVYYILYSIEYKQLKKSMIDAWTKELDSMEPEIQKKAKEILKKLQSEK